MTRDQIISKIHTCTTLPSLPTIALKVLQLARNEDVDIKDLAELISNDPALSGKVLRTVNSPFYGLPRTVSTISNSLVILGTESVRTLVLGFSLVRGLREGGLGPQMQLAYWRRSIYSGVAARLLCQRLGMVQREEVFLAALLQDIGVQALKQVAGCEYDRLLNDFPVWDRHMAIRERQEMGLCHCEAGMLLAEQWRLPPMLADLIRWHHHPQRAPAEFAAACRVIGQASRYAEVFMGHAGGRQLDLARRSAHRLLTLAPGDSDLLLAEIANDTKEMTELFEINIGQHQSYDEILAEASETLQDLSLRSQIRVQQIKAQAETDSLTGLANRRKLDERLAEEFRRASEFARPLSVLFIDADNFKKVNDTHGHATGDDALKHLARIIASGVRPMDLAGRYGGEEFLVVLPEATLSEGSRLAEQLRSRVAASPMSLPDGPVLAMTISVGVAGFNGLPNPYRQPQLLVQAADRATYAAKAAGRNTVRVFSPKQKSAEPVAK